MSSARKWYLGCIGVLTFFFITFFVLIIVIGIISDNSSSDFMVYGNKIAVIEVEGMIIDSEPIIRQLKKYRDDKSIPVVLIRVDSPGGAVAPTQEIYEEIKKLKEKGKKVVVSIGSLCASGGYYISCPADFIFANPGSIVGSIGVVMEFPSTEELLKKIGVDIMVVKSGKYKDIGSPTRTMTDEEKALLQGLIDDVYNQFVSAVVDGRKLKREDVIKIADGRVLSGKQALEVGLVDTLGNIEDAIKKSALLAGYKGEPNIIKEKKKKPSILDLITESTSKIQNPINYQPPARLEYRW